MLSEINEDPVRLYLKEIGNIDLLTSDQEFWLATRLDAFRRLNVLSRQHPLARQPETADVKTLDPRLALKDPDAAGRIYRALYEDLTTSWSRVIEDTRRLAFDRPDFMLIISEAQMLRTTWQSLVPSYLRAYLNNGLWGIDPLWNDIARIAFTVFLYLYMLPETTSESLKVHIAETDSLPEEEIFLNSLPDKDLLLHEIEGIIIRSEDAQNAIIRANLRLVVSVAKRYIGRGS